MNRIAIITVAYNRIGSLSRLLSSLECAYYGEEQPTLIISIDKSKTDSVEKFADNYVWPHGDKIVRKHDKNLGLRSHMMSLGEWFKDFETFVILEDDIVVSPCFYIYARQASDKYYNNPNIAGLSLYSFAMNYHTWTPFMPKKNEYDAYFMNCAMSWGEVWMKQQWKEFYSWYLEHQEFTKEPHLPESICLWDKSWLKYHTRYCIENNKYFVFPYVSLSTDFGDAGTHNTTGVSSSTYQVQVQQGRKYDFRLPDNESDAVCYDAFFENKDLCNFLGLNENDCCIDLYGMKRNRLAKRYWLTTCKSTLPIVRTFGVTYKPMEMNIINQVSGDGIFLYDVNITSFKIERNNQELLYRYNIDDITLFLRKYGIKRVIKDFVRKFKIKL